MKNTILMIAGAALVALSSIQFAAAAEQQHRAHHRAAEFRDSNAFVAPSYDESSRYSGGALSAPAGR
jgi:hypothetical protein